MEGDSRWLANYNPRASQVRRSAYEHFPSPLLTSGYFFRHFAPWRVEFIDGPHIRPPKAEFFPDGSPSAILFDCPDEIFSLATLGQLCLTPFSYHPSRAVGSSWASPYLERNQTSSISNDPSPLGQRAEYLRMECLMDYSYLLNEALYDHYFVSGCGDGGYASHCLPVDGEKYLLNGASFNVNSASPGAWKILLRTLPYDERTGKYYLERFPGHRLLKGAFQKVPQLDGDELDRLAEAIVDEVRRRGPFASLSQFINRKLGEAADSDTLCGAIQGAIARTNSCQHPIIASDDTRQRDWFDREAAAGDANGECPSDLTQADLLHYFGNLFTVRGDTFLIRGYGEAIVSGATASRICEALVRRLPDGTLETVRFRWIDNYSR
jgi:hypothetical protein